jgi:hypothetical protein
MEQLHNPFGLKRISLTVRTLCSTSVLNRGGIESSPNLISGFADAAPLYSVLSPLRGEVLNKSRKKKDVAEAELAKAINNYKPDSQLGSSEEFKQLANGFLYTYQVGYLLTNFY